MNKKQVKDIERALNNCADVFYETRNGETRELNRGYCKGINFVLENIGYRIVWDNGKATVVEDD